MDDASQRIAALSDEKRELLELLRQEKLGRKRAAAVPPSSRAPEPAAFTPVAEADRARLPDGLEDAYPLTLMQAGMLYHMEREPEHALYHNVDTFRVEGLFRPELFQRAVDRVVLRHPVLRTSFDLRSYGEPLQLVHREAHLPVWVEDLRGTSPELHKAAIDSYVEAEKARHFDFASPPLLRFGVHLLAERTFQFTVTDFHPILDGWSLQSTLAEILSLYGAMLSGEELPEALPTSTFREFVHLERQALASEEHRIWWERLLEGASPIRLPRWPQPARSPEERAFCTLAEEVPADLFDALRELARMAAVPLKSVFLACHLKAMELLSGRSDILTGLVSHGRPEGPGGEDVRGLFLNTLPFRLRLPRGSWIDLARAVFEVERELVPFRRYPLPALQQRWGQERLFEAAFNFTHFHVYRDVFEALERSGHGLRVVGGEMREETSFTLLVSFNVEPLGSGMHIAFLCHLCELPEPEVAAIVALYFRILRVMTSESLADHTQAPRLLGEVERHTLLREWNDTAAPWELPLVHERFADRAELQPAAEAVRCGERSLTYGELRRLSAAWAARLRREGVGPEGRVALCLDRSPEAIVAILAVLEAGGAYVPLDPGYPGERLAYMLDDSGARLLLTSRHLTGVLPSFEGRVLLLEGEPEGGAAPTPPRPLPDNLAYLLYTSGSTGRPKGVAMPHGALANLIEWQLGASDRLQGRTLQFAPLSFDVSFQEIFATLCAGGALVLVAEETRRDMPALLELLRKEQIERLFLPFVALQHLAETAAEAGLFPSALREVITAGEQLQVSSGVRTLFRGLPASSLHNQYGPTEAHVVSALPLRGEPDGWPVLPPIGRPIANDGLQVLGEGFDAVPRGVAGELCIGGLGLARGYLGRPDLTAERFVPDPFAAEPGARLYRTGDLARHLPDGNLEFLGRADRQVKIRGFRIEPGSIEAALAGHPEVQEAVVAVREETSGRKRLVAYVVARPGRTLPARELRSHLAGRLPEHEIPSAIVFLDSLPLTPSGKVDRRSLPSPLDTGEIEGFVALQSPVEEVLAGIWAEVLHCDRVGATDNFFELGGHSLVATQVVARVRQVFGVELPVRAVFELPVLKDQARRVESGQSAGTLGERPPLLPSGREGRIALSFAQQRLWFLDQMEPGQPSYNIPIAVRLEGALDVAALAWGLGEVAHRHEALRTTFRAINGEPAQVISDPVPVPLPVIDVSDLPDGLGKRESLRLATEEALRLFDLEVGPLLRASLVRQGPEDHLILLSMHHIVSDGWSMEILVRELSELYASRLEGRPPALPDLPVQYADYAIWQRGWLVGDVLEAELSYWRERLRAAPPALELPADRPRTARRKRSGGGLGVLLPAQLLGDLRRQARRHQATPFMILLAGFQALLARYTGQEDLTVGTPIAGRTQLETEALIGFFVNTLVLRGDLSQTRTFSELIEQARERTLEAHTHQHLPFERLVEELRPERSLTHSPFFQVMLVLQNLPAGELAASDLRLSPVPIEGGAIKFELTLQVTEAPEGLQVFLAYDAALFDWTTIARWAGHFERLLTAVLEGPERPMAELSSLGAAESSQILYEWNDTRIGLVESFLDALVSAQALRTPEAVAIEQGTERWTYRRLVGSARYLASHLRDLGVGPNVIVGICAERSPSMVVGVLAILEAGGAYLPLEPTHPVERLAWMLEDSGASVILADPHLLDRVPAGDHRVVALGLPWDEEADAGEPLAVPRSLDNLAYILYTSGSTGRPKGVMVAHRNICNRLLWAQEAYRLDERDAFLHKSSLGFDVSVEEIFAPLLAGARLVLAEPGRQGDGAYLVRLIQEHRVTLIGFVPSMLEAFAHEEGLEECTSLRQVFSGGEALSPELRDRLLARLPAAPLHNQYGPTEISIDVTFWPCVPGEEPHRVPIGRPIGNMRLYVTDRELRPVPIGVAGELMVAGIGVSRGYLRRPELTAERFVPDPFGGPGERLYRTGDLSRWLANGNLEYLSRIDQQVKIRGFRIELGEIETALRALPGVRDAVVVLGQDRAGEPRLVAYCVSGETAPAASELRERLRRSLPDFMVPSAFVALERFPVNSSGKLDRRALPEPQIEERTNAALHGDVEELLAGVWTQVLRLEAVGADDNFFDLGGHSLLATQVVSRVHRIFGVELPVRTVFEAPVLREQARRVEEAMAAGRLQQRPPLVAVPRDQTLPLSFAQQRLWFLDQMAPGQPTYNIPLAVRLEGELDRAALASSLAEVVRRHEALRTTFPSLDGEPVQEIAPPVAVPIPLIDLTALPEALRELEALDKAGQEVLQPFDLASGPLLRLSLLRLARHDHLALVTVHHIVSDGWSMEILLRELSVLYAARRSSEASPLPELPIQYADFAVWQRHWLEGEPLEAELDYWRKRLEGLPPRLNLPADRPRTARQERRGVRHEFSLPPALTKTLRQQSQRHHATVFMTLLAGFQALLGRYAGQDDLAVGAPIAGRTQLETEPLVGFFVNTLVLRGDLSGDPDFASLMARTRERTLEAHAHQHIPFERLVEELKPERSLTHSPLFQVMFSLQNVPEGELSASDLRLKPVPQRVAVAKFELTLNVVETPERLPAAFEYDADLFDSTTIARWVGHFERLLTAALEEPERPMAEMSWLGAAESSQVLCEWNDTRIGLAESFLDELVSAQASRTPEAVAIEQGTELWTYQRLVRNARNLARHLRDLGVGPDVPVGLYTERSPSMVVGMLAILEAGGAYLPLELTHPAERLAWMLEDSSAPVILADPHLLDRAPVGAHRVIALGPTWDEKDVGEPLARERSLDDLAYVLYTSGSTGRPKGVMVAHRSICNRLLWAQEIYRLEERDAFLQKTSFGFDVSVMEIFAPLLAGARLVLAEPGRQGDSAYLVRTIREHRVTLIHFVPSMLEAFVHEEGLEECTSLRQVFSSGEALSPELRDRLLARLPAAPLHNQYGPTEISIDVTLWPCVPGEEPHRVPIGRPIGNMRLYVMDREFRPVSLGVTGELMVAGIGVARGYLRRPELTAERFVPDPFGGPGERLYHTGDLARWLANGNLEYLGRIDQQVKIRGFRIELGEIETALRALPGVRDAVVVLGQDRAREPRLVAYFVPEETAPAPSGLREKLRRSLPDYMVPSAFVALERFPVNSSGKLDRRALPEPQIGERTSAALHGDVEELLAGVWTQVLRLETVGADDDFFDLGGHSLLATQVVSRVHRIFGVELPVRAVFEAPVFKEQARRVEEALAAGRRLRHPPLVAVPRDRALPLSFAQQRLWFLDRMAPGQPTYNIPLAIRLEGELDRAALTSSLGEVVRRHEALRTTFLSLGGEPVQVIAPPEPVPIPLIDLTALPEALRDQEALDRAGQEVLQPFDLASGPLLRISLICLAQHDHLALVTVHHIVSDGWSMERLLREMSILYAARRSGEVSPLPELPVQYADFAVWQRHWLEGEPLEAELAYWRERLEGLSPRLDLPTDRPRTTRQERRGVRHEFSLPQGLTMDLRQQSRRYHATVFMTLLAGFQALLGRYAGQDDLAVGAPIAGRTQLETEPLIGFFVNTLVLRGDLSGDPGFASLVARTRERTLEAHAHQHIPFERLVEELKPERSLTHSPLFQVMFSLQNVPEGELAASNLRLKPVPQQVAVAKFELTLNVVEAPERLPATFEYDADLFEATTIARWAGHFERLLAAVLEEPERPLAELSWLGAAESNQLLYEWNDTGIGLVESFLDELVSAQALRTPEAVAIEQGTERWTYRRLVGNARRLARHLRGLGVGPDVLVGLCAERSPWMVAGVLAILDAGGAYLPLEPSHPAERLAWMLEDSGAPVILASPHLLDRVPAGAYQVIALGPSWDEDGMGEPLAGERSLDDLAYVLYTSGSTGRPKGVMVAHRNICNRLLWAQEIYRLEERDAFLQKTSFGFDVSVMEIFAPLLAGARLVLTEPGRQGDSAYLVRTIQEHRVTLLHFVPSMLEAFAHEEGLEECTSLRQVFSGGEVLSPELRDRLLARLPAALHNQYGPTEASIDLTFWPCAPGKDPHRVPIGRPIGNMRLYVVDRELRPVPLGVAGELVAGGIGLSRGYLRRPELTAERFVPDPFGGPGKRLYRTGDLARWLANGSLEYLGRIDQQVKVRGFRIELGEIETALRTLPGVRDAAVVLGQDRAGEPRLVAYFVPGETTPAVSELRETLRRSLPDFMVPSSFVALERFPVTASGKLDRRALPEPQVAERASVALQGEIEELLAGVWAQVLRLEAVGADDDFFDLGGHSLLATQVVSRVHRIFGVELPVRAVFEAPVLREQARRVEEALAAGRLQRRPPLVAVPRDRALPLSFAQQRLWFLDQMGPGQPTYNIPLAVRLEGELDRSSLAWSLGEVVHRHEALRTTFLSPGGEPVQVIAPPEPLPIPLIDLTALPEEKRESEARHLAEDEARRPFGLSSGPVLRASLVQLAQEHHLVLLTLHHIVSDGWSMEILIRELVTLYSARREGSPSPLPPLAVQYADYAVWQRSWLEGEALTAELDHWQKELRGVPVLELPTDRPRPPVLRRRAGIEVLSFSLEEAVSWRVLARSSGATLFMVGLAGLQELLARYAGQRDFCVGTPIAGRSVAEVEALIGFFVNTLALRTNFSGVLSFRDLLARTRSRALEAYAHQDFPFERLVEAIHPERSLNQTPLFQVMFTLAGPPREPVAISGLELRRANGSGNGIAKFDLTVALEETGVGELFGAIEYDADLFDGSTVRRMVRHLELLLEQAARHPDHPLDRLELLGPSERDQLLVQWNDTRIPGDERPIQERILTQAERTPEALAVVSGEERLTYGDLIERARSLADRFRAGGVSRGAVVAVLLERSPDRIVTQLAALLAGAAYLPIDPATPAERVAFLLRDSAAAALLAAPDQIAALPAGAAPALPDPAVEPEDLAYVIYTSGSTGLPKGVEISQAGLANLIGWHLRAYDVRHGDRASHLAGLGFDASVWEVWPYLAAGATVLLPPAQALATPSGFWEWMADERITHCFLPTPLAEAMLEGLSPVEEPRLAGLALRFLLTGGDRLRRRPAPGLPFRLVNHYGPTESSVVTTAAEVEATGLSRPPIGRPIDNLSVYVLESGADPMPVGVPGELYIGGAGLARGYRGRPELTAERFVPDPLSGASGGRLYRTGDRVRWLSDGSLDFLGRVDQQVKIRGIRVEPGEIEAALVALPEVLEAAVTAREETSGEIRLVGYVVPAPGAPVSPSRLREALAVRLPEAMIPATWRILPELPLNASGKLDRQALPALGLTPAPGSDPERFPPRDTLELRLTEIWYETLGREALGVQEDFFDLGGHSLLALRLMARIEASFGKRLPLTTLFQHRTVESLALLLRQEREGSRRPILVPIRSGGSARPLFLVHPVGGHVFGYANLVRRLDPEVPVYGLEAPLPDGSSPPRLESLAARYVEALRTVQPDGPCRIGGWSLGGWIAWDMARQIQDQGGEVERLVLIDTVLPDRSAVPPKASGRIALFAEDWLRSNGREVPAFNLPAIDETEDLLRTLVEMARRAELLPPDLGWDHVSDLYRSFESNLLALTSYEPAPWEGSAVLFRATGTPEADRSVRWEALTRGGLKVRTIAGDHYSILRPPQVSELARALGETLAGRDHS